MLIDWFSVAAQVLNFLILVWLLKRFLYKPILHAIDAREKRIASALADADAKKVEAVKESDEFRNKNEAFDRQHAALLNQVTDEARIMRLRLLDEARQAADALRAERQNALQREHRSLNDEIARRTREEVFAIARKTLTDLAGISLEQCICEMFTQRLHELNPETKEGLAKAFESSSEAAVVRSAFALPKEQQVAIQNALNETFSSDVQVRFEAASAVISGIEFSSNGRKVAWSIAEYLKALEKSVGEVLQEHSKAVSEDERNTMAASKIASEGSE